MDLCFEYVMLMGFKVEICVILEDVRWGIGEDSLKLLFGIFWYSSKCEKLLWYMEVVYCVMIFL